MNSSQPILEVLDALPSIALDNIKKKHQSAGGLTLPTAAEYVFGHLIDLTPVQKQDMRLSEECQIVTDWQEAKTKVYQMLKREGMTPRAIVPKDIFHNTVKALRIIPLTDMTADGKIFVNPFVVDYYLSSFIPTQVMFDSPKKGSSSYHEDLGMLRELQFWWASHYHARTDRSQSAYQQIVNERITFPTTLEVGGDEGEALRTLFSIDYAAFFLSIIKKYDWQANEDAALTKLQAELEKRIRAIKDNPYGVYQEMRKASSYRTEGTNRRPGDQIHSLVSETFSGKVVFPPLPEEFQRLLTSVKMKFPHWPLYTAADPEFFRVMWNGIDVYDYAQNQCDFWMQLFLDLKSRLPEVKRLNEKFTEQLKDELAKLGTSQKHDHLILSEEDLRIAINREKDPIFYAPITERHKNVDYQMVIIWGQTGESPREAEAIRQLEAVDHRIFMGTAAN